MNAPLTGKNGKILRPWNSYLSQFTQAPAPVMAVAVGVSPYSFLGREPGSLLISGGTVTAIHLLRGSVDLNITGTVGLIPVQIADTIVVTYSVLPTIQFLPSFGASPQ